MHRPEIRTILTGMSADDSEKELAAVLIGMVGRVLSMQEVYDALEMSRTTFSDQRNSGRLIAANNLITAARNLGINEVDLLTRFGIITPSAAIEYVEDIQRSHPFVTATTKRGVQSQTTPRGESQIRPRADRPAL